jgi:hypothetical protein
MDGVVPFTVEFGSGDANGVHFVIRDGDALGPNTQDALWIPNFMKTFLRFTPSVLHSLSAIEHFEHWLKCIHASDRIWFQPHLDIADPSTRECSQMLGQFFRRAAQHRARGPVCAHPGRHIAGFRPWQINQQMGRSEQCCRIAAHLHAGVVHSVPYRRDIRGGARLRGVPLIRVLCGQSERARPVRSATDEFIRRFMLHVLPKGFHRIRHYGLLASAGRKANVARARQLLAWCCVGQRYAPLSISQKDAMSCLTVGLDRKEAEQRLAYYIDRMRVLNRIEPTGIRFAFDTLAEYMAALHVVQQFGSDDAGWSEFLDKADRLSSEGRVIHDLLTALSNCCSLDAYQAQVPAPALSRLTSAMAAATGSNLQSVIVPAEQASLEGVIG